MAEEFYYQSADGGEIKSIPFDQIPSFATTSPTPITLDPTVNDDPNWAANIGYTPRDLNDWVANIDYAPRDLNGWTTIDYTTYDPNEWTTTTAPYLRVDRNGIARWYQNGQPGEPYGWPESNFTFRYPDKSTRHADPKPEPVDTHELDEFIDSLKVVEGEDDV